MKTSTLIRTIRGAARASCRLMGVALFILSLPDVLRAQEQINGVVAGRVTDSRGQPQHLLVQLSSPGEVLVGVMYTDSNGNFVFSDLRSGVYYVIVEAADYKPARERVEINARNTSQTQVVISLEPVTPATGASGQTIVGSRKSYTFNVRDKSWVFDPRAVREFEKGNEKEREKSLESAIRHYQKALKIDPDFYPALNNLGAIYLRQKDHAEAEAVFLKSVKSNPQDGEAYINLGHVYYERAEYLQAIEQLNEGLKLLPESPEGHFFLGSAYLKLGDLLKAEEDLRKACSLDPGMASAHLQLANLYLRRRDMNAASAQLRNYLESNPSDPQAPAIKKVLANIAANQPK